MRYIDEALRRAPELSITKPSIERFLKILMDAHSTDKIIYTCGNGGSASDAEHISGELLKSFMLRRGPSKKFEKSLFEMFGKKEGIKLASGLEAGIRSISLVNISAFTTAYGNDKDWKMAFAQLIHVLGRENDILLSLSTSGNSDNILNAMKIARAKGLINVLITGESGGKCAEFANCAIKIPSKVTYMIQEYTEMIYHAVCADLENTLFGD